VCVCVRVREWAVRARMSESVCNVHRRQTVERASLCNTLMVKHAKRKGGTRTYLRTDSEGQDRNAERDRCEGSSHVRQHYGPVDLCAVADNL